MMAITVGEAVSADVPVVTATHTASALKVDGRLDEPTWSQARKLTGFELVGSKGPATQQTEARICYDRNKLYVSFVCHESRMDSLVVKHTEDHAPVWQDDSVEVFIAPFSVAGEPNCHQFVVNAAGAKAYLMPGWVRHDEGWDAAVTTHADRWIVEMATPLSVMRPLGRNEDCWRVNLCRNEWRLGESSSWCPVPDRYGTYSRFARLKSPNAPCKLNTYRGPLKRLQADQSAPAGLLPVTVPPKELDSPQHLVIPQPQEMRVHAGKPAFKLRADTLIAVNDDTSETDRWAVDELNDTVESLLGKRLQVVHSVAVGKSAEALRNLIIVGESARNPVLKMACEREGLRMPRSEHGGHVVDVQSGRIVVSGTTPVDTFHGVQTLKQLLKAGADGAVSVPSVSIRDYPTFAFRGAHLLASKDACPYISKLIDRVLAPLKVNHIVLQTDKVAWKTHPEVTDPDNCMPQEDVRKLIEVAREHHITVTPMVQSPGHLEWAFRGGKNLEFAEDPEHPYCYCMSNPKSYDFIFDIMDEAIELFGEPEFFHAGRDEFDMDGRIPHDEKCKAVGKERLYIQDTLKVYEHLRSRGCKMMMWGDILTKPGFRELAAELPRDILINDWRYAPAETYPSVDFYQEARFPVVGCTWYDPRNVFTFSRYAAKRSILGMMQTTWTGFKTEEATLRDHPDQVYAYILSAAWAWNPKAPDIDDMPYKPRLVFEKIWRDSPSRGHGEFAVVGLGRYCNISRADSGRGIGWLGLGRGNDLRALPAGMIAIGGVPYRILPAAVETPAVVMLRGEGMTGEFPQMVEQIPVGSDVKALHLLHACAYQAAVGARVGTCVIRYEDGDVEQIPLIYGNNTYAWDDQSSGMSYGFAWRSRAQDGRAVGVCELTWTNPRPEVKVVALDLLAGETQASPFVIAITAER